MLFYNEYDLKEHITMNEIVLFDGDCNLCDKSVHFIINRDQQGYFKFAAQQSNVGQQLLKPHPHQNTDSIVLITKKKYYTKSSAALRICKHLDGPWKIFFLFLIVPRPIRDFIYDILAKNRYKWFGKKESCFLPTPDIKKRFL